MYLTGDDTNDSTIAEVADMLEGACSIIAASKMRRTNIEAITYVDEEGNDKSLSVYGYYYYTWKLGDTLDAIAQRLLGDADYGTALAYYNGIQHEADILAGASLKIPILGEDSSVGSSIYAPPELQDNYGIDIKLSVDKDIATKGEDIDTIAGANNLTQAIALRLSSAYNKRIRLVNYGIRSAIGDPMALKSYLVSSIQQTILADPRIDKVDSISFKLDGDKLAVDVIYTDVNGAQGEYAGAL